VLPGVRGAASRRVCRVRDLDALTSGRAHDLLVFTGVASGLSGRRAGLRKALAACTGPEVGQLVAGHPDRLARFGTGLTGQMLAGCGVTVTCNGRPEDETAETELVRDMLAIVTFLAGRLCGQRPAKTRRLRAAVAAEARSSDAA
jgi:predicted site-specific integrase-resolvase